MSVPNPPEVTPCPSPAPSTTDTINFDARADQYHAWLPNFVNVQLAAVIEWIRLRANEVQGWANSVASAVTAAATSATNAANSATSAGTSATSAGTSATSAGTSAAAAQASLNTFRGQYYGPLAADPTADPLGNAPGEGDLYWHTGTKTMRAFNGTAWAQSYLPASAYMDLVSAQTVAGVKTFSSNPVLSAGTANALAYLNSGKTLSFSADLTFDGTTITSTGGSLYLKGTNSDTPMAGNYARFGTNIGLQSNAANSALVAKMFNGSTFVDALTLNTSGNLGLGVTPSAWVNLKGIEIGGLGNAISGFPADAGTYVTSNAYYGTGGWRYGISGKLATRYSAESGVHSWSVAPSGTAGNAITFTQAMTLDASGKLSIGTTTTIAGVTLNVVGGINSTNGALNVSGTGGFYNAANKFGVDNSSGTTRFYSSGPNSSTRGSYDFRLTDSVGSLDISGMTLDSSGNLNATGGARFVAGSDQGTQLNAWTTGGGDGNLAAFNLIFNTGSNNARTERARIDSSGNFIKSVPTTPPSLATNGTMVFNLTSNTNLRVSVRGSDGVTRTANLTLA